MRSTVSVRIDQYIYERAEKRAKKEGKTIRQLLDEAIMKGFVCDLEKHGKRIHTSNMDYMPKVSRKEKRLFREDSKFWNYVVVILIFVLVWLAGFLAY